MCACAAGDCRFPADWHGRWFQSGLGQVVIRERTISHKGTCHEYHRDFYLVENKERNCYQCLILIQRHRNIIQYKESYCISGDSLSEICHQIRVEAILYTLVREPSLPVPCPFQDAYHFSYNNNTGGFCRAASYVHACASDAKFRFKYKHCPEAAYTYNQELDFECLAAWKDGSDMFMYGSFVSPGITEKNDVYRCFMYQMLGTVVYLAMSADATCRGLRSSRDGPLVMEFTQDVYGWPTPACSFPEWFTGTSWQDLSGRHLYLPGTSGETVAVSHRRHPVGGSWHVRQAFRCIKQQSLSSRENEFVAVSYSSQDCLADFHCVKIVQRHSNILEIYNGDSIKSETQQCTEDHFKESRKHVVYPRSLHGTTCPYHGRYRVTSQSSSDCRVDVISGCSTSSQLDIVSSCVSKPVNRLECLQTWREDGKKYLIARQLDTNEATANCLTFEEVGSKIVLTTDRRCNRGGSDLLGEGLPLTLDAMPGPCELPPVEKPRVTQPVERSEEPRSKADPGYKVAPPDDDPNVAEYEKEYENKHEFFHNSGGGGGGGGGNGAPRPHLAAAILLPLTVFALGGALIR